MHILNDWRSGVLLFLIWLLFEDLARKYLGNSMTVFFAKDFLVGVAYLSFFAAKRKHQVEVFKIPFLLPLAIFFWFAVIQVFNTWSPSILYGLLGLKMYFYYAPLMLLGYAMMDTPKALERFLVINVSAGIVIAGLGIAQAVLGVQFLTPDNMAPELYEFDARDAFFASHHQAAYYDELRVRQCRPLFLLFDLALDSGDGRPRLLVVEPPPWRQVWISGHRRSHGRGHAYGYPDAVRFRVASALMMTAAFLWGAPWRWGQGHRIVKALRRAFLIGAIGLILMGVIFPTVLGANWAF